jgi:hypothetical protein
LDLELEKENFKLVLVSTVGESYFILRFVISLFENLQPDENTTTYN